MVLKSCEGLFRPAPKSESAPQQGHAGAVFAQALVTTQQFDLLMLSLADQQPIKGIFVVPGQVLYR